MIFFKKRLPRDIIKLGKKLRDFSNKNIPNYHTIYDKHNLYSTSGCDIISIHVIDDLSIIKILGLYYNRQAKILSLYYINTVPSLEYIRDFLEHIAIPLTIDNKKHIRFNDTKFCISLENINKLIGKLNDEEFELFNSTLKYNI